MDKLLTVIKIVALTEVILIGLFILLMYLTKAYFNNQARKSERKIKMVRSILTTHLEQQIPLSPLTARWVKKPIGPVLGVLKTLALTHSNSIYWDSFTKQLSELILKPVARKLSLSRYWLRRYQAAQCYYYGFELEDEKRLTRLLNDPSLLVSINAATVVVRYSHPALINKMITFFSEGRHLRQTSFAEIIGKDNKDISAIIFERLENEGNLYVKLFCYRLLRYMPAATIAFCARRDLKSDSIDLKIAVLNYLVHCQDDTKKELIYPLITDSNWQVRSAVAKALGKIKDNTNLKLLTALLGDPAWWVRMNAATSLGKKGEAGLELLKIQLPHDDQFVYEVAQAVLISKDVKHG